MINTILLLSGIIVLVVLIYDVIFTCFSPSGAGFFSGRTMHWLWKTLSFLSGNKGESKFLNLAGPLITSITLAVWIIFLWIGNSLIFMYEETSVLNASTNEQTSIIEKIFFTGYVLSTMGLGDYKPAAGS